MKTITIVDEETASAIAAIAKEKGVATQQLVKAIVQNWMQNRTPLTIQKVKRELVVKLTTSEVNI